MVKLLNLVKVYLEIKKLKMLIKLIVLQIKECIKILKKNKIVNKDLKHFLKKDIHTIKIDKINLHLNNF